MLRLLPFEGDEETERYPALLPQEAWVDMSEQKQDELVHCLVHPGWDAERDSETIPVKHYVSDANVLHALVHWAMREEQAFTWDEFGDLYEARIRECLGITTSSLRIEQVIAAFVQSLSAVAYTILVNCARSRKDVLVPPYCYEWSKKMYEDEPAPYVSRFAS